MYKKLPYIGTYKDFRKRRCDRVQSSLCYPIEKMGITGNRAAEQLCTAVTLVLSCAKQEFILSSNAKRCGSSKIRKLAL